VAVQFFASAIAVDDKPGEAAPALQFVRATIEGQPDPAKPFLDDITVRAITEPMEVPAGAAREHHFVLYHGPVKVRQLSRLAGTAQVAPELVDRYADTLHLKTLTDYGSFGFWTDLIILFTNLIHRLVGVLMAFLPAGLAIICVTIIVRLCMLPISFKQAKSMQRMQDRMQKLAPEMKEIDRKFHDDFLAKRQAQSDLYRRHGVNPAAGLGGCLMLFLQMPIFMGLYYALQESVFFRLEPFLWIRNLTAPDMLMWWGQGIPGLTSADSLGSLFYIGPFLNLLPLVGAVLIFIQQKASMPKEMTEEQRQQFTMMKYMTFLMAFMFYKVPAGLSLYFIASSAWGLTERALVKRHLAKVQAAAPPPTPANRQKAAPPKPPSKLQEWWQNVLKEASKK
jgi:YidC/Oxa1 family membrane protein insertase